MRGAWDTGEGASSMADRLVRCEQKEWPRVGARGKRLEQQSAR